MSLFRSGNTFSRAERLKAYAERLGLRCVLRGAQTGTHYLTIETSDGPDVVIRIANHSDCYGRADYTADGVEGDDRGARRLIATLAGGGALAELERREAAAKGAATRKARVEAAEKDRLALIAADLKAAMEAWEAALRRAHGNGTLDAIMGALRDLAVADAASGLSRKERLSRIAAAKTRVEALAGVPCPYRWTSRAMRAAMREKATA